MTESKTGMSFSRRNFIKGAAALTATGALVGCAPAKETLAETGEEPVEVPPQALTPTPRTGFTVVEWGGTEVQ